MTMRSVQDRFWSDGWVRKLNPLDRYLFLYLLTNEHTNWAGVYELEIGMMAYESGIDERDLERSMLPRLGPKIIYIDGWVYIPNWVKHHMSESGTLSPQQKEGVRKAMEKVPAQVRRKMKEVESSGIPYTYPMVGVSPSSLSLSSALLTVAEPPVYEIVSSFDEEKSPKRENRTNDKLAIYHIFSKREEPWWIFAHEKKSALSLFDLKGVEQVQKGKDFMLEYADDQFCPQASTPSEYVKKLPQLMRYKKKHGL